MSEKSIPSVSDKPNVTPTKSKAELKAERRAKQVC